MLVTVEVAEGFANGSFDGSENPLNSKKGAGVTPGGKRKDVRLLHPSNAPSPSVSRAVLEKSASTRAVHPAKVPLPMVVIVSGTIIFVMVVDPLKRLSESVVILVPDKSRDSRVEDISPVRGSLNELELSVVTSDGTT